MVSVDNVGVPSPTGGVLVYAPDEVPRVELNWQMAETAERIGYHSVWVGDSNLEYQAQEADYFIVRFASPNQTEQLARFTESVPPSLR